MAEVLSDDNFYWAESLVGCFSVGLEEIVIVFVWLKMKSDL